MSTEMRMPSINAEIFPEDLCGVLLHIQRRQKAYGFINEATTLRSAYQFV